MSENYRFADVKFEIESLNRRYDVMADYFEKKIEKLNQKIEELETELSRVKNTADTANRWAHSH